MLHSAPNPAPFTGVLKMAAVIPAGRWQNIAYDAPVPGTSGTTVTISAVIAAIALAEGSAKLRYVAGASPALVVTTTTSGRTAHVAYRLRDHAVVTTSLMNQPVAAAIPLGAAILVAGTSPAYTAAHTILLDGIALGTPQSDLDDFAIRAGDALATAIEAFDLGNIAWSSNADPAAGELDEALDPSALPLDRLFSDPASFAAFTTGSPTEWDILRVQQVAEAAAEIEAADPSGFVGPQQALAVRYMREGKHVLHHGPTGTGKSFVWDLAMRAVYGDDFDPQTYPYFVHGSAGLEDIDFIGQILPMPDGSRQWIDGPLVRAMRDGKRLKVEEMNRISPQMVNVLMGAMDYGRIALTRHLGEVVTAAPGFAVDAMANIGREYTGTDTIDAAHLRRFQRKIEYDFLPPAAEVGLLRGRFPTLDREDAETLVRIATTVREAYEYGNGDLDVDLYVSHAGLLETAEMIAGGSTIAEAIEATWLSEVAQTKAKREKVRAMVESHIRERRRPRSKKSRAA